MSNYEKIFNNLKELTKVMDEHYNTRVYFSYEYDLIEINFEVRKKNTKWYFGVTLDDILDQFFIDKTIEKYKDQIVKVTLGV